MASPAPRALLAVALMLPAGAAQTVDLKVPFEKHVLDNGLQVVIHEDHSDPVVAVYVVYHVGSGREEPGRSGFAHLFEHLMFQGSQHVGDDQHFKLVSEAGGSLNGTTNRDRTNYFETMPANQLELALWLEADRMGFLLPSITQEKLDNQREVVKNERRQNYENRPYGQAEGRVTAALYPHDHPYSWLTIGSHEDLTAASLEDVVDFFTRWYGPNNATLAIGGDVDPGEALALVERYFGSIPRGPEVARPRPRPVSLEQGVRLVMEDKVKQPQLEVRWPGAPRGHAHEAALDMLASVLSANKAALLDKALTVDETLATRVSAGHQGGELAGEFSITLQPAPGVSLDTLEQRLHEVLAKLGRDGVEPERLARLKARYESQVVSRYETVSRRTNALAEANVYTGDPGSLVVDLQKALDVTTEDIAAALQHYLLGRPAVVMSVVPVGHLELAASGRDAEQSARELAFDRGVQPAPGAPVPFSPPPLWHAALSNGVPVTGTRYSELPLVTLTLSVPGGHLRESMDTLGVSSLTADLMDEGTAGLDAVGLTDALDALGASLSVRSSDDELNVSLQTLTKHLEAAVALLGDVALAPRLDPADFERVRTQRLTNLESRGDNIRGVAGNVWQRLTRDDASVAAWPGAGTLESVAALTLDDVKAFHRRAVVSGGARLVVVGDVEPERVRALFEPLVARWPAGQATPLADAGIRPFDGTRVFLVDRPGVPQSEIRIGQAGLSALDPDYYPFSVMNYVLGGTFSSRINMNLREDKGYTYGARSGNDGDLHGALFTASAGVRTDATAPSVVEFMKELNAVREGLTEQETEFARDSLLSAMGRQYESIRSLSGIVDSVSRYGWPDDYLAERQAYLRGMGKAQLDELASRYLNPAAMQVLVVGDATAVSAELEALGFGPPIELDIDGNPVDAEL